MAEGALAQVRQQPTGTSLTGCPQGERLRQLRTKNEGWLRQTKWVDPPARSLAFAEELRAVRRFLKEQES